MNVLLTDILSCPRCGPEFGLILLSRRTEDRRVLEGVLGCANCRDSFPVDGGLADLRPPPRAPLSTPDPEERGPTGLGGGSDLREPALRTAALLGAAEGPGKIALLGGAATRAGALADLLEEVEVIAVAPDLGRHRERPGVSRIIAGPILPFFSRSMRGVAIAGGWTGGRNAAQGEAELREAARLVAPGARLVIEGDCDPALLEGIGLGLLAQEGGVTVAGRP